MGTKAVNPISVFMPVGTHTQNTSIATAANITVPAGARQMMAQAITQDVRYTLDGATAPTASKGFLLSTSDGPQLIPVRPAQVVKVIAVTTGSVIDYQFGV